MDDGEMGWCRLHNIRCLCILGSGEHHHVCRGCLGLECAFARLAAVGRLFEEPDRRVGHAREVSLPIGVDRTEQILRCLLGQVGLLEHSLRRVDVRQVQRRSRVARVKDGRQSHTGPQRTHHDSVHIIVHDMPRGAVVDRVDHVIVSVVLVAVQVGGATAVAGEMHKERVMGLGILDEPLHGPHDVGLGRDAHRVLLVVGEDDHVLTAIAELVVKEARHVGDIVDAPFQGVGLSVVVDADEEGLATTRTS